MQCLPQLLHRGHGHGPHWDCTAAAACTGAEAAQTVLLLTALVRCTHQCCQLQQRVLPLLLFEQERLLQQVRLPKQNRLQEQDLGQ